MTLTLPLLAAGFVSAIGNVALTTLLAGETPAAPATTMALNVRSSTWAARSAHWSEAVCWPPAATASGRRLNGFGIVSAFVVWQPWRDARPGPGDSEVVQRDVVEDILCPVTCSGKAVNVPYASNGSVRIHYVVEGAGPPLLLHHGFTGSSRDWESFGFVAALRDTYQLIMLDARGHGASDTPHDPGAYTVEDRVGDVLAVLDDLGIERAHYYGYSYGGMMGWALGTHAPERFASLAIGGAHPYAVADAVWTRLDRMRAYLREGMESYIAWRESQIGPWPPAFRERVLANDAQALEAMLRAALNSRAQRALATSCHG